MEWMLNVREGFDIVIGNPPYIDSELMKRDRPEYRQVLRERLETTRGNWDLYIAFTEVAYHLLRNDACLSFILPNKWLSAPYGKTLRNLLQHRVAVVADCSAVDVFEAGNTPVVVLIRRRDVTNVYVDRFREDYAFERKMWGAATDLQEDNWGQLLSNDIALVRKIGRVPITVGDLFDVQNPFTTGEAYKVLDLLAENRDAPDSSFFRFVNTGTISKFRSLWGTRRTTYLKSHFDAPAVDKKKLRQTMHRRATQSARPKLILKGIRYFDGFVDVDGGYVAGKSTIIVFDRKDETENLQWLSAILNAKLTMFLIRSAFGALGIDGGINFSKDMVAGIRLPTLSASARTDLISLAIAAGKLPSSADTSSLESQIDQIVYRLYGLTDEEIAIVEGSAAVGG